MTLKKKRSWAVTLEDIAAATRQSIEVVRDHKQDGRLQPWDLVELTEYVMWKRLRKEKNETNTDSM